MTRPLVSPLGSRSPTVLCLVATLAVSLAGCGDNGGTDAVNGGAATGGGDTGGAGFGGAPTGGLPAGGTTSGGATSGGAASGGLAAGGTGSGGVPTGGASTGGLATGGAGAGGTPTGGANTGGADSGGTTTGGTATGGVASGGLGGGGAAPGGAGGSTGGSGAPAGGAGGLGDGGGAGATGGSAAPGGASSGGDGAGGEATGGAGATGPTTVWLAGDSTVANGNTPCPTGWGKVFDARFDDRVTVVNSAAGGRSVRTWMYSVTTTMGGDGECVLETDGNGDPVLQTRWVDMLAGMKEGDTLFIQFGINDGSSTCDRHVGLETFKDEYGRMAEAARDRGALPVFITPVSAIACSGSTAVGTRGGYVTATFEAGTEYGVPVIDLHQRSVDLYNQLGFCPVPGGDVSASTTGPVGDFFCDDHTHFSPAGAEVIAGVVADAVAELGLPLASYLL